MGFLLQNKSCTTRSLKGLKRCLIQSQAEESDPDSTVNIQDFTGSGEREGG